MGPGPSSGETSTTPNPDASLFDGPTVAVTVSLLPPLSKDPHRLWFFLLVLLTLFLTARMNVAPGY